MNQNTQILAHLLNAAAADESHAAELLLFLGSAVISDASSYPCLNTDEPLVFACIALSAEEVQRRGLRAAFSRCYALTVFQRSRGSYLGGDPESLENYDEVRYEAEKWLKKTDTELLAMILAQKLLSRFVGNYESFNFALEPISPYDWEDRSDPV